MPQISKFIGELKKFDAPYVFNTWRDYESKYDIGRDAPEFEPTLE